MSPSYGYSYLTSYGWTGTGGLRKDAIAKPLAIPQKKNLNGLGKDRDEAFPFWDHLFAAASKAITIKLSSDDESEDTNDTENTSAPFRRTTTGILSNRRPVSGTPASTSATSSGNTTPSLVPDTNTAGIGTPSLLATAKREAARRGLYARFFRGPVLGPDNAAGDPSSAEPSSSSTPEPDHVSGVIKKRKERKSEDIMETAEERKERKRLRRERRAARAARKAEKMSAGAREKKKRDRADRKARKRQGEEVRPGTNAVTLYAKGPCKQTRKYEIGLVGDDVEQTEFAPKRLGKEPASAEDGQQNTNAYRPPINMVVTGTVLTTKKKGKRKNAPSS